MFSDRGASLNFSPGKARWASFRVLEPHVTATKIHRATRVVARVWHLLGRSFVRLYKSEHMQGRRRVQHVCIVVNLLSLP